MTLTDFGRPDPPVRYRAQRGTHERIIFARLLRAMHRDSPPMARLFLKRWKAALAQTAGDFWGTA